MTDSLFERARLFGGLPDTAPADPVSTASQGLIRAIKVSLASTELDRLRAEVGSLKQQLQVRDEAARHGRVLEQLEKTAAELKLAVAEIRASTMPLPSVTGSDHPVR